jgi:3,4-dihydroxy 2-butanone 4-phosphate synthase/GTP cyclohydrolase II
LQDLNLKISRVESIEVTPNPFNIEYLMSKKNYGHLLYEIKNKQASERLNIPYTRIEPFIPYALKNLRRFVHVSSYFLPIKPVDNEILLNKEQFESFAPTLKASDTSKIVLEYAANDHYVLKIKDEQIISQNKSFLAIPYWFKVNVYFDIASFQDFIVLTYGNLNGVVKDADSTQSSALTVPVVRIHSESISNRFPLKNGKYKNRLKF